MLRYLFYFILFFILFYGESISIGPVTVSHIWKIPLVIYLLIFACSKKINEKFVVYGLIFAFLQLFNTDLFASPLSAFTRCARFMTMPLLFLFFTNVLKKRSSSERVLLTVAQYFILATIPYHLGWLQQNESNLIFGATTGFMGFFQNLHAASITLAISSLVVGFFLKDGNTSRFERYYNAVLLLLGVYGVYATFVRTGMVMLVVSFVIFFFPKPLRLKPLIIGTCILSVLFSFAYYQFEHNEDFRNRILDNNKSVDLNDDNWGSGRAQFWEYGLELFKSNQSLYEILFGIGATRTEEAMNAKFGLSIGMHNGFADALLMNGLIGLTMLLLMFYSIFRFIYKRRKTVMYRLALAFFMAYVVCYMTQGNIGFPLDLFTGLILSTLYLSTPPLLQKC